MTPRRRPRSRSARQSLSGVLPGDQVSLNPNPFGLSAFFNTPSAGSGKPVTVIGLSLVGSSATNYALAQPTGLTATIAPAPLILKADSLTMNAGGPVPTLTFTATGLLGSDTTTTAFTTQPTLTTTATSSSPPGVYPITITGGAAPNYTVTQAIPGSLTVVLSSATTTTLISSSSNPAVVGEPVTFTADVMAVSPGAGTPTGVVTFFANGNAIGSATVNAATGLASFTTSNLGFGANSIIAVYSGDSVFQGSQSGAGTQFISHASTQSILTVHVVRNKRGRIIEAELVVQVLVNAPGVVSVPTGNVTFTLNVTSHATVALKNGTAVLKRAPSRLLGKFVFARYNGNSAFEPSVSLSQIVGRSNSAKAAQSVAAASMIGRGETESPRGR